MDIPAWDSSIRCILRITLYQDDVYPLYQDRITWDYLMLYQDDCCIRCESIQAQVGKQSSVEQAGPICVAPCDGSTDAGCGARRGPSNAGQ